MRIKEALILCGNIQQPFVEATHGLLVGLPEQRDFIEEALNAKLLDPDEKIRAAVCKLYSQLDYETALHHVTEPQLRRVAERGLDKKHSVRIEALNSIGKLYSLAYPEIENGDQGAIKQFSWIPESLLQMSQSQEVKVAAENSLAEYVFPLIASSAKDPEIEEPIWTDRLLTTMKFLNERSIGSLISFSGLKIAQCCRENNGGIIDENEEETTRKFNACVQRLSTTFPEPQKAADDLCAFAKLNESRLYKLLETCMDTQTNLKSLIKSSREFLRRIEQSSAGVLPTFAVFLRRASLRLINQSSIPSLLRYLQRGDSTGDGYGTSQAQLLANNAHAILTSISKHCPVVYKAHLGELTKAIADERNPRLVGVCLQALAALARRDKSIAPGDKYDLNLPFMSSYLTIPGRRTIERVMRFALDYDHRRAKYSARLLATSENKENLCYLWRLDNADDHKLLAHISVLAELAQTAPDSFESKSEVIMNFIVKQILMSPSPPDPGDMDVDIEWIERADVPPSLSKRVLALKVCRNRCLAHAESDTALDMATPALKMFFALLENGGSLHAENDDDPKVKARMRLQAAVSLLHLSTVPKFAAIVTNNFISLAITIQFVPSSSANIYLSPRINNYPSLQCDTLLTVHDPEADIKNMAKAYVSLAYRASPPGAKMNYFEMIFVQFLHLLAHHPDSLSLRTVCPTWRKPLCIERARSAYHQRYGEAALMDTAEFTHESQLPTGILRPLPNAEAANKILKQVFLPPGALDWLSNQTKSAKANAAEVRTFERPKPVRKSGAKRKKNAVGQMAMQKVLEGGVEAFTGGKSKARPVDALIICVGLGARTLGGVDDKDVYPVRGQTVLLRAPWIEGGRSLVVESVAKTYIVPRRDGTVIVGGTKVANDWFPKARPETTINILERGLALYPELAPPSIRDEREPTVEDLKPLIIEEGCGLRPARKGGIRIQSEWIAVPGSESHVVPIIHNYGHGGYGFQTSWGSALATLTLLEGAFAKD
ncbi:hypothetical protein EDB89DRAFT_2080638 [Lactarius sanguifluus]|nr:hypothetical protein EDB89DRAFT_2080638 [Lactarius sanguifluus]